MDGIHDLGGMQGFGKVTHKFDPEQPVFHEPWHGRALALTLAMGAWKKWNLDSSRHAREKLPPSTYLSYSYYERWVGALTDLMVEHGLISLEELKTLTADPEVPSQTPPLTADKVRGALRSGGPTHRDVDAAPQFRPGDEVVSIVDHPGGHCRLPRYARGRQGKIVLWHGAHVLPDSNAHYQGEAPEHLYAVRFKATTLWGEKANPNDSVTLDLWESYLSRP